MNEKVKRPKRGSWLRQYINPRAYTYIVFGILLLIVLYKIWPLPFFYFSKTALLPSANALTALGRKIISPIELIKNISSLDQKNEDLEKENKKLESQLARSEQSVKNCKLLSLEVDKEKGYSESQTAKVIGRTAGGLNFILLINKGTGDDLHNGDAVLTNGYFIGKIQNVREKQAEVILIFSHSSMVPVVTEKNNQGGLLQGGLEGLSVSDIPIDSRVETGDKVVTSGLGGELPEGLIVGDVGENLGLEGDLFQKVKVISPINPYQINYVTVLKNEL